MVNRYVPGTIDDFGGATTRGPYLSESFLDQARQIPGSLTYNGNSFGVYAVIPENGRTYDLTEMTIEFSYSNSLDRPYSDAKFTFKFEKGAYQVLQPGNWIMLYGPTFGSEAKKSHPSMNASVTFEEIDRFQIIDSTGGIGQDKVISVEARDPSYVLVKNTMPYKIPEGTLANRLRFLESQGVLQLREPLIETQYVLPTTRGGISNPWQDISYDIAETNMVENKKYIFRQKEGRCYIEDLEQTINAWVFQTKENIFQLRHKRSIEEFYNVIYVLSADDESRLFEAVGVENELMGSEAAGFAMDPATVPKFGQHVYTVNHSKTVATPNAQAQAEYLLSRLGKVRQTASVESYSLPGIRPGNQILIREPETGVIGRYFVQASEHQINGAGATMRLDVEFELILNENIRPEASGEDSFLEALAGLE